MVHTSKVIILTNILHHLALILMASLKFFLQCFFQEEITLKTLLYIKRSKWELLLFNKSSWKQTHQEYTFSFQHYMIKKENILTHKEKLSYLFHKKAPYNHGDRSRSLGQCNARHFGTAQNKRLYKTQWSAWSDSQPLILMIDIHITYSINKM